MTSGCVRVCVRVCVCACVCITEEWSNTERPGWNKERLQKATNGTSILFSINLRDENVISGAHKILKKKTKG